MNKETIDIGYGFYVEPVQNGIIVMLGTRSNLSMMGLDSGSKWVFVSWKEAAEFMDNKIVEMKSKEKNETP